LAYQSGQPLKHGLANPAADALLDVALADGLRDRGEHAGDGLEAGLRRAAVSA